MGQFMKNEVYLARGSEVCTRGIGPESASGEGFTELSITVEGKEETASHVAREGAKERGQVL